jgi:very-short-patch-repair endonuclease
MNLNNLPDLRTFRRKLRSNLTPAEARLWSMLKNSQLEGRKFRRQHSFGGYILDLYCSSEKLGIELDGEVHFNERAAQYDHERSLFLRYFGVRVLRFENRSVFENREWLLREIRSAFGWRMERSGWIDE